MHCFVSRDCVGRTGTILVGFLGTRFTVSLANRGVRAKRLNAIELASKRVKFWDDLLNAKLKVLPPGSEQETFKDKASQALDRIHMDAGAELLHLGTAAVRAALEQERITASL